MRYQIRGLNKASNNIEDGISLIQVAEGALNETHSVLQRARELAVQAANDTNTPEDRKAIQAEIDEIVGEVDRIANQTCFNGKIYPLRGEIDNGEKYYTLPENLKFFSFTFAADREGTMFPYGSDVTVNGFTLDDKSIVVPGLYRYRDDYTKEYIDDSWFLIEDLPKSNMFDVFGREEFEWWQDVLFEDNLKIFEDGRIGFEKEYSYDYEHTLRLTETEYIGDDPRYQDTLTLGGLQSLSSDQSDDKIISWLVAEEHIGEKVSELWIQSGALEGQGIKIDLVNATSSGIGLKRLDVSSFKKAGNALKKIDNAIDKVSTYRANFGAQQNRLEHARAVDDNTSENTSAAESRIRDTDMAKEMVDYSKQNILQQVGQSMIAQANQSQQGILSLIG